MKFNDNEIRDITRLLEAGKPLPEKYRFTLFGDVREIELVWNGKKSDITNVVLPFQIIEHIDEPRLEEELILQPELFDLSSGRQLKGWTNKLIWGDNKFILSSLKNGPAREDIEANGGIKLIYIDPPFDVGADFTMEVQIGDETLEKEPNILEEIAYRDTWGKGNDSFLSMIYERLILMKDLLSEDGFIMVHCDWRVNAQLKLILCEIFGESNFRNEIVWQRRSASANPTNTLDNVTDSILFFSKSSQSQLNEILVKGEEVEEYIKKNFKNIHNGRKFMMTPIVLGASRGIRQNLIYEYKGYTPKYGWMMKKETLIEFDKNDKLHWNSKGKPWRRMFADEYEGQPLKSLWNDLRVIHHMSNERLNYPTQKPEVLLERIIEIASKPEDIICDFFAGSGTTASVAERLGRKWICSDLGKFSIHTSRKRLITTQRKLKKEGKNYRAFEVLNLGKYERELFVSGLKDLDKKETIQVKNNRERAFNSLILQAYQAEPISGFRTFRGQKNNRMVSIGPVNMPVSRLFAEEIVSESIEKGITKVDLLAFEFEMGLFPSIQDDASQKGVDLVLKNIPKEIFDKRAVERGEAKFHDVAYIDLRAIIDKNNIAIELTNYSVFYTQGITSFSESKLKNGKSQIIVENGHVLKISKDKYGITNPRINLTKNWHDWIDYWSIDFDYTSKKEIILERDSNSGIDKPKWTGSYIFENEWQSFRTIQDRSIELKSTSHEFPPGRRKIAVKVVDIFGNDTMKVIPITIGGKA